MPVPCEGPYVVEVDDGGCERCGRGKTWTVVGPDGVAASTSWENEEDADDYAAVANRAYLMGHAKQTGTPVRG